MITTHSLPQLSSGFTIIFKNENFFFSYFFFFCYSILISSYKAIAMRARAVLGISYANEQLRSMAKAVYTSIFIDWLDWMMGSIELIIQWHEDGHRCCVGLIDNESNVTMEFLNKKQVGPSLLMDLNEQHNGHCLEMVARYVGVMGIMSKRGSIGSVSVV